MIQIKKIILLLLCVLGTLHLRAQIIIQKSAVNGKDKIGIDGIICNNFTHAALDSAFVTLMKEDSTVIDTMTCKMRKMRGGSRLYYGFTVPRKRAKYIIKVESEGYETLYKDYEVKYPARNQSLEIPDLLMQKTFAYDKTLDEVEVVATKVQMVFKGDTIVYDADAFNVPEGSMLDGLIRQMPGVELSDDGVITVNGRKIDRLTLNGDDFMRGDNNILLKNLPYFTVKNIKVFNKVSDQDEGRDIQTTTKDFVMDVRLKKEYNRGFMGNVEVGGGTHGRYMSRFFGMMFTDLTKVTAFGNLNNVNETRHPGENGDWDARKEPQKIHNYKNVGVNVNTKNREDKIRDNFNANFSWNKTDEETRFASTNYLNETKNFSRRQNTAKNHNTVFGIENRFTSLRKMRVFNNTNITFGNADGTGFSRSALFMSNPELYGNTLTILDSIFAKNQELAAITINRNLNRSYGKTKRFNATNTMNAELKLPWGDYISGMLTGTYSANDNKSLNLMQVDYLQGGVAGDFRNNYTLNKGHNYSYSGNLQYSITFLCGLQLRLGYNYKQVFSHLENPLYKLDQLSSWSYNERTDYSSYVYDLGILPDEQQVLDAIDTKNSVYSGLWNRSHGPTAGITYNIGGEKWNQFILIGSGLNFVTDNLHYERGSILADNKRRYCAPGLSLYTSGNTPDYKTNFYINATRTVNPSDVVSMVGYVDDTNPLAISMGNPELKNGATDKVHFYIYRRNDKHHVNKSFYITYTYFENAVTQGYSYDKTKGIYTYKPMNVNGNNEVNTGFHYVGSIGKKNIFTFNNHTDLSFRRYVQMALPKGATEAEVFGIHGTQISQRNDLTYKKGDLTLSVGGEFHLKHNESKLETFNNNTLYEFNYGFTAKFKMPLDIYAATDVKMSNIRGMEDKNLNVNQIVWNGKLSKSFFKGKIIAILEGYDILGKLKNVQYYVNSEGATSYWVRTIPSYAMLHLQYKFNIQPKKK